MAMWLLRHIACTLFGNLPGSVLLHSVYRVRILGLCETMSEYMDLITPNINTCLYLYHMSMSSPGHRLCLWAASVGRVNLATQ